MSTDPKSFLTPEEIQSFKKITLKVKGLSLNDSEAEDQGTRLVKCFELFNKTESKITRKKPN